MKNIITSLIVFLSIASSVLAIPSPEPNPWKKHHHDRCFEEGEAKDLLDRYISLFEHIDPAVANRTLTENIQYWSDSLDYLFARMPGSITGIPFWANRSALVYGQTEQQNSGITGSFSIRSWFYGCYGISFAWRFNGKFPTGADLGYAGIDHLIVDPRSHLISTVYGEDNNGELLYHYGYGSCPLNQTNATDSATR